MNSPFIITNEHKNLFTVSWPTYTDIRTIDGKMKLLTVIFNDCKIFDEVGLVIKLSSEEVNVLWIKPEVYFRKDEIGNYMQDYYTIVGVTFRKLEFAETIKDYLEKKLIWKILNA